MENSLTSKGAMPGPQPRSLKCLVAGVLLFICCFCAITFSSGDIGWTCDEVYYYLSSDLIVEWCEALIDSFRNGNTAHVLSRKIVDDYWLWDLEHNPHPPFYKLLSGITWRLFRGHIDEFVAYRLSSALLTAVLVTGIFAVLFPRYGVMAGSFGGLSFLLMPRLFGHAHLAATEAPLMAFWFLAYWAFWKGLSRRSGSWLLALFVGMGLATKFTGLLIPGAFLLWTALYREKRALRNIMLVCVLSPLVALLLNPGWWYDPLEKIAAFVQASLSRDETIPISTYYIGRAYRFSPPWTYAPVMAAITIPATTLLCFFCGVAAGLRDRQQRAFSLLLGLNIVVMLAVTMLPGTPVHDGVRQFIYLFPFVACFAGIGLYVLVERVRRLVVSSRLRPLVSGAVFCIMVLCPLGQVAKVHPYELCYYNELVGGVRGGRSLGMETTYWFDVINRRFLRILNHEIPRGAAVSVWPLARHYFDFLQERGRLRKDIRFITPDIRATVGRDGTRFEFFPERPQYLVLMSRLGAFNDFYWNIYRHSPSIAALRLDGVTLVALYRWEDIRLL